MIDTRIFSSVFTAVVAAGLVLLLIFSLQANSWRLFSPDTKSLAPESTGHASKGKDYEMALAAASAKITELEATNDQQRARIAYLEKQRFDLEKARTRRANEANFERWYAENMPQECLEPPVGDLNVECINDRIRAKRQFFATID